MPLLKNVELRQPLRRINPDRSADIFANLLSGLTTVGDLIAVSRALVSRGILDQPMKRVSRPRYIDKPRGPFENVAEEWTRLARSGTTIQPQRPKTKLNRYYPILAVERWLTARHPEIQSPEQWTRTTAADSVVMMMAEKTGEWSHFPSQRDSSAF